MQTIFSVLLTLQFLVVVGHDWIDVPGWVYGSRVQSTIGRRKLLIASSVNAVFPGVAVALVILFWNRPSPSFVPTYWAIYCAVSMMSAIAMWYVPYFFGASEKARQEYLLMYSGTRQVLPARGDNPRPNLFHILIHLLFATTLILSLILRFRHT